jgi:hypothetical protein
LIFLVCSTIAYPFFGLPEAAFTGLSFAAPVSFFYSLIQTDRQPVAADPQRLLRTDLKVGAVFAGAYGLPAALTWTFAEGPVMGAAFGFWCALSGGLIYGLQWMIAMRRVNIGVAAFVHLGLAIAVLGSQGKLPLRTMRFLRDAHKAGILRRQAGGVYEFRHRTIHEAIARNANRRY